MAENLSSQRKLKYCPGQISQLTSILMFKDHYFSHSKEITRIRSIGGLSLTPAPLKTLIVASLILIAPLVSHPSLASTPVILTSETSEIKLNRHCDYFLEDSLAATSQPPSQATFQPITHDNLALGFSNKTVWLKCSFISRDVGREWITFY